MARDPSIGEGDFGWAFGETLRTHERFPRVDADTDPPFQTVSRTDPTSVSTPDATDPHIGHCPRCVVHLATNENYRLECPSCGTVYPDEALDSQDNGRATGLFGGVPATRTEDFVSSDTSMEPSGLLDERSGSEFPLSVSSPSEWPLAPLLTFSTSPTRLSPVSHSEQPQLFAKDAGEEASVSEDKVGTIADETPTVSTIEKVSDIHPASMNGETTVIANGSSLRHPQIISSGDKAEEATPWQPGWYGKGMVDHDNRVHIWSSPEADTESDFFPSHFAMEEHLGTGEPGGLPVYFALNPDGAVRFLHTPLLPYDAPDDDPRKLQMRELIERAIPHRPAIPPLKPDWNFSKAAAEAWDFDGVTVVEDDNGLTWTLDQMDDGSPSVHVANEPQVGMGFDFVEPVVVTEVTPISAQPSGFHFMADGTKFSHQSGLPHEASKAEARPAIEDALRTDAIVANSEHGVGEPDVEVGSIPEEPSFAFRRETPTDDALLHETKYTSPTTWNLKTPANQHNSNDPTRLNPDNTPNVRWLGENLEEIPPSPDPIADNSFWYLPQENEVWVGAPELHHSDISQYLDKVRPGTVRRPGAVYENRAEMYGSDDRDVPEYVQRALALDKQPWLFDAKLERDASAYDRSGTDTKKPCPNVASLSPDQKPINIADGTSELFPRYEHLPVYEGGIRSGKQPSDAAASGIPIQEATTGKTWDGWEWRRPIVYDGTTAYVGLPATEHSDIEREFRLDNRWSGNDAYGWIISNPAEAEGNWAYKDKPPIGWFNEDSARLEPVTEALQKKYLPDQPKENWAFESSNETFPWQPGVFGKGLITPEGEVHSWSVGNDHDGNPWHETYSRQHDIPTQSSSGIKYFTIGRNGEVQAYGWEPMAHRPDQETAIYKHLGIDPPEPWEFTGGLPPINVVEVPASQEGWASEAEDDPRFGRRRPFWLDGVGNVYLGEVDQLHDQLFQDAEDQGHTMYDHMHRGCTGFYGPEDVTFFDHGGLKPEYKDRVEHALTGKPPAWSFEGSNQTYYHVAPPSEANRINAWGLQPGVAYKDLDEVPEGPFKEQPKGVYLYHDPESAFMHATPEYQQNPKDIHQVTLTPEQQRNLIPDPQGFGEAVVHPNPIAPEQIQPYQHQQLNDWRWKPTLAAFKYRVQEVDSSEATNPHGYGWEDSRRPILVHKNVISIGSPGTHHDMMGLSMDHDAWGTLRDGVPSPSGNLLPEHREAIDKYLGNQAQTQWTFEGSATLHEMDDGPAEGTFRPDAPRAFLYDPDQQQVILGHPASHHDSLYPMAREMGYQAPQGMIHGRVYPEKPHWADSHLTYYNAGLANTKPASQAILDHLGIGLKDPAMENWGFGSEGKVAVEIGEPIRGQIQPPDFIPEHSGDERTEWEPGNRGKALVGPDGTVVMWNSENPLVDPHHWPVAKEHGWHPQSLQGEFTIDADGTVIAQYGSNDQSLRAVQDAVKGRGGEPDQWSFKGKLAAAPIYRGEDHTPGMPRPIAPLPNGKMAPVPWTQLNVHDELGNQGVPWGQIDVARHQQATGQSLCLLCGEPVQEGKVVVEDATSAPEKIYDPESLLNARVLDNGPLHDGCAAQTAAHCPDIKTNLASGRYVLRTYRASPVPPEASVSELPEPPVSLTHPNPQSPTSHTYSNNVMQQILPTNSIDNNTNIIPGQSSSVRPRRVTLLKRMLTKLVPHGKTNFGAHHRNGINIPSMGITLESDANELESWSPGNQGKGLYYHDGTVQTWNIDPETWGPHHYDMIPNEPMLRSEFPTSLTIDPSGLTVPSGPGHGLVDEHTLQQHHPALHLAEDADFSFEGSKAGGYAHNAHYEKGGITPLRNVRPTWEGEPTWEGTHTGSAWTVDGQWSGGPGKGLVYPSGHVHVWETDGSGRPHHSEIEEDLYAPMNFLEIDPDGSVWDGADYSMHPSLPDALKQINPKLHIPNPEWHLKTGTLEDSSDRGPTLDRTAEVHPRLVGLPSWSLGNTGKGLFDPQTNEVKTWNTDEWGNPHHFEMRGDISRSGIPLWIQSDGNTSSINSLSPERLEMLQQHNPAIHSEDSRDQWKLGTFSEFDDQPNPDRKEPPPLPDLNWVPSVSLPKTPWSPDFQELGHADSWPIVGDEDGLELGHYGSLHVMNNWQKDFEEARGNKEHAWTGRLYPDGQFQWFGGGPKWAKNRQLEWNFTGSTNYQPGDRVWDKHLNKPQPATVMGIEDGRNEKLLTVRHDGDEEMSNVPLTVSESWLEPLCNGCEQEGVLPGDYLGERCRYGRTAATEPQIVEFDTESNPGNSPWMNESRPWLYHPPTNTIYMGGWGSHHPNVYDELETNYGDHDYIQGRFHKPEAIGLGGPTEPGATWWAWGNTGQEHKGVLDAVNRFHGFEPEKPWTFEGASGITVKDYADEPRNGYKAVIYNPGNRSVILDNAHEQWYGLKDGHFGALWPDDPSIAWYDDPPKEDAEIHHALGLNPPWSFESSYEEEEQEPNLEQELAKLGLQGLPVQRYNWRDNLGPPDQDHGNSWPVTIENHPKKGTILHVGPFRGFHAYTDWPYKDYQHNDEVKHVRFYPPNENNPYWVNKGLRDLAPNEFRFGHTDDPPVPEGVSIVHVPGNQPNHGMGYPIVYHYPTKKMYVGPEGDFHWGMINMNPELEASVGNADEQGFMPPHIVDDWTHGRWDPEGMGGYVWHPRDPFEGTSHEAPKEDWSYSHTSSLSPSLSPYGFSRGAASPETKLSWWDPAEIPDEMFPTEPPKVSWEDREGDHGTGRPFVWDLNSNRVHVGGPGQFHYDLFVPPDMNAYAEEVPKVHGRLDPGQKVVYYGRGYYDSNSGLTPEIPESAHKAFVQGIGHSRDSDPREEGGYGWDNWATEQGTVEPWKLSSQLPQIIHENIGDEGHGMGHPFIYYPDTNTLSLGTAGGFHSQLDPRYIAELGLDDRKYLPGRVDPDHIEFYDNTQYEQHHDAIRKALSQEPSIHYNEGDLNWDESAQTNWKFTGAGTRPMPSDNPEPATDSAPWRVHEVHLPDEKITGLTRPLEGLEYRRPIVWDDPSRQIYVGPLNAYHYDLINAIKEATGNRPRGSSYSALTVPEAWDEGGYDQEVTDGPPAGMIGYPDHRTPNGVYEAVNNHFGGGYENYDAPESDWTYTGKTATVGVKEHDNMVGPRMKAMGYQPDIEDEDFRFGSAETPEVVDYEVEGGDPIETNIRGIQLRRPWAWHPSTNKVYVGPPGSHHVQLPLDWTPNPYGNSDPWETAGYAMLDDGSVAGFGRVPSHVLNAVVDHLGPEYHAEPTFKVGAIILSPESQMISSGNSDVKSLQMEGKNMLQGRTENAGPRDKEKLAVADDLTWAPGQRGKGWILTDGSVWTWPIDDQALPYHMHKVKTIRARGFEPDFGGAFQITEDGQVHRLGRNLPDEKMDVITRADPRLSPYSSDQEWTF